MNGRLEGRNALITGGARGAGEAIATRFAEEGSNLFICDINIELLEKTATRLRQFGRKVIAYGADVSDRESVQKMAQHAFREYGRIDILVNNAAIYKGSRFVDCSLNDFDQIMKVNLYGVFHVTQAFLPAMIERRNGKVINVASVSGKWGNMNQSAYNASKHAILGLTRCIALEVAPHNINVNAICPGTMDTEMGMAAIRQQSKIMGVSEEELRKHSLSVIPLGRFTQPKEVAHLAVYLASDESNGMTGQSISLCGGRIMV
jgi:meso-butanediol dehydrogenase/(S,S)-butanediol dehydrogenase/diacetyl reductase